MLPSVTVCPLAAGLSTDAAAMTAGAVLLLATVPARAEDARGASAFFQITQDKVVGYGLASDYPTRDDTRVAEYWIGCEFRPGTGVA